MMVVAKMKQNKCTLLLKQSNTRTDLNKPKWIKTNLNEHIPTIWHWINLKGAK